MRKIVLLLAGMGLLLYACKKNLNSGGEGGPGGPQNTAGLKANTGSVDLVYRSSIYAGTGATGETNGTKLSATFNIPEGVAFDSSGNMFVTDRDNHCIRKITTGGTVSVFAGSTSGVSGFTNGTGTAARFHSPLKLAIDGSNNIYVADRDNNAIRKITSAGVVTTLAGSSSGTSGNTDGTGSAAKFNFPVAVATTSAGTVYVADAHNYRIRKITSAGVVTTLAGSSAGFTADGATGTSAKFNDPSGVAIDASGNIIVADRQNHCIRKVTTAGVVTTIAGSHASPGSTAVPDSGLMEGPALKARFKEPYGVCVAPDGAIFITDIGDTARTVRRLNTAGEVFTVGGMGMQGSAVGDFSEFYSPTDVAVDASGNLYVADIGNNEIRMLAPITGRRLRNTLGWSSETIQTGLTWYKFYNFFEGAGKCYYYCRWAASLPNGAMRGRYMLNVNVLDVDLNTFKLVVVKKPDWQGTNLATYAVGVTGAVAAVNSAFGEHHIVTGIPNIQQHDSFLKYNGTIYWHASIPDEYWFFKHWAAFHYDQSTSAAGFIEDKTSPDPYVSEPYSTIISGYPRLLTNNVVTGGDDFTSTGTSRQKFDTTRYARTAIVRNSTTNHILFITFDDPNAAPYYNVMMGVNTGDEAQFIHDYFIGYDDALNIDGGASTTMWIKGHGKVPADQDVVNIPYYNHGTNNYTRQSDSLLNAIMIVPKP